MSTMEECMDRRIGKRIQYLSNQNRAYANGLLKAEGLTHGECNIIVEIYRNEGLSQEDLKKRLNIDKSAITRVLKGMIEKGYVERCSNDLDRRYYCLYTTDLAKSKIDYIFKVFQMGSMWLLEGISDEEANTVIRILDKMCDNVRKKVENNE